MALLTCKNEEDPIKNLGARVLKEYINFSDTQWQLTPQSVMESGRNSKSSAFMVVLVTYKNEEDPIKNEGDRVLTTFLSL